MVEFKPSEKQIRALFEAAQTGIIAVDTKGKIALANAQAEKMFGFSRQELIGRPVELLVPERFRDRHVHLRERFECSTRPMGVGREMLGLRKDGTEFMLEIGLNSMRGGQGEIVVATLVDITERKRADEREQLLERARASVEVFQQFGIAAAVLEVGGRVHFTAPLFEKVRSHFVFSRDRVKLVNTSANNIFMQAVASLDAENSVAMHSNSGASRQRKRSANGLSPAGKKHCRCSRRSGRDHARSEIQRCRFRCCRVFLVLPRARPVSPCSSAAECRCANPERDSV